jgi:hypothetical protein
MLGAGPAIGAVVCFVALLPHLMWLAQAHAAAPLGGDGAVGPWPRIGAAFAFMFGQAGLHLGLVVVAGLALLPRIPLQGEPAAVELAAPSGFDRSLIVAAAVLPSLLVAAGSVFGWFNIGAYTGSALVAFSGLALVASLPTRIALRAPRLAVAAWLLVLCGVPIGYTASLYTKGYGSGPMPTELYPARALSGAMQTVWKSRTPRPLDSVTGSAQQAGYVALYATPRPSVFVDADPGKSPWMTPQRLKQFGTLVVWTTDEFRRTDELPPPYRAALAGTTPIFGTMVLPLGGGKLKAYGWAMILPEGTVPIPPPAKPAPPPAAVPRPQPAPPAAAPVTPPPASAPSAAPVSAEPAPPATSAPPETPAPAPQDAPEPEPVPSSPAPSPAAPPAGPVPPQSLE